MSIQNVVMTVGLQYRRPVYQASTKIPSRPVDRESVFLSEPLFKEEGEFNQKDLEQFIREAGDFQEASDNRRVGNLEEYTIPLDELILYWRHYGAQHNNKRFTAVILRNSELNAASLVFSSANVVGTGSCRPELTLWLLHSTLEKLRNVGFDRFEMPHPHLVNLVSSGRFPNTICINLMVVLYSDWCKLADKFPGVMVFHPDTGKRVTLIFKSGKVCNSGAHNVSEIKHDIRVLYEMLVRCQYTIQNQKDDDECAQIVSLKRHAGKRGDALNDVMKQMKQKIEDRCEQHNREIKERRLQSAQNRRMKRQQQAVTNPKVESMPTIKLDSPRKPKPETDLMQVVFDEDE
jgi:TATA-box binding protein (TBP) (component of TFIID and TFIIIB)